MNNPQADALNDDIKACPNAAYELLSELGREAFFPAKGILGQTSEAKGCSINATIGTAFEEDGSPLCLECLEDLVNLPSETFLYAPSYGLPGLRKRWREMLDEKNPSLAGKTTSLPVVTNALTHALSIAGHLLMNPGDQIIIPDLFWGNYNLIFKQPLKVSFDTFTTYTDNKAFNCEGLRSKLAEEGERKIVLLNFPNNPSGYTVTTEEAHELASILIDAAENGKKISVLLDDAYFGLVYEEGIFKESLFALLADAHPNLLAIKLDGPTKEDYVWGFRVGFITFGIKHASAELYKALEAKTAGLVRGNVSNISHIAQEALLIGYRHPDYKAQKESKYQQLKNRHIKICEQLSAYPEYADSFEVLPFNSGYFMCVRPIGVDAEDVRNKLINDFSTGVINQNGLLRLAFSAISRDKIEALLANIHQAIQSLK